MEAIVSEPPPKKAEAKREPLVPADFIKALREAGAPADLIQVAEGVAPAEIRRRMRKRRIATLVEDVKRLFESR